MRESSSPPRPSPDAPFILKLSQRIPFIVKALAEQPFRRISSRRVRKGRRGFAQTFSAAGAHPKEWLCALSVLCVRPFRRKSSRRVRKGRRGSPVLTPHETIYRVALCVLRELCVRPFRRISSRRVRKGRRGSAQTFAAAGARPKEWLCALSVLCVRPFRRTSSRRERKGRRATPALTPHQTMYRVALCVLRELCVRLLSSSAAEFLNFC